MSGWFSMARDFHDHPAITGCPGRVSIWTFLVGRAAWKDTQIDVHGTSVPVPRGSICISTRELAERTFTTHQVVRTALERFKRHGLIRTDVTQGRSIITICNYDKYQLGGEAANTASNTAATQQQHIKGQETKGQDKRGATPPGGTAAQQVRQSDLFGEPDPVEVPEPPKVKAKPVDDVAEGIQLYNLTAERAGWPRVQNPTDARRKALKARLKEVDGIEGWTMALGRAEASDFCCGRSTGWQGFCFDWLVKAANFTKLMEGNYDNRSGAGAGARGGMAGAAQGSHRDGPPTSIAGLVAQRRAGGQGR